MFCEAAAAADSICTSKLNVDLAIVIDTTTTNFQALINFVISVVDWFDVGQSLTRVSIVSISDSATAPFLLNQYDDRLALYSAIRNIVANTGRSRFVDFKALRVRILIFKTDFNFAFLSDVD